LSPEIGDLEGVGAFGGCWVGESCARCEEGGDCELHGGGGFSGGVDVFRGFLVLLVWYSVKEVSWTWELVVFMHTKSLVVRFVCESLDVTLDVNTTSC
jgi:hypothetical protein